MVGLTAGQDRTPVLDDPSAAAYAVLCRSLDEFREQQMPLQPAQPTAGAAGGSLEQRWWLPHVVLLCCQLAFAVMHVSSHAVRSSG